MYQRQFKSKIIVKTAFLFVLVGCSFSAIAKQGMWLPPTLKQKAADMKSMGFDFPIDELYNADGTGLNNAIVLFGKGCTGEIISSKGLILTNHHCGYGTVQGLSSQQHDYFANGFFAMNLKGEIPCPGLTVTFIRKMENVSDIILAGISDTMKVADREKVIADRIQKLEKGYRYTSKMDATIKPFFNGNQYWVILSETYNDIRLVGFPPNGIGQFGGDTDNWMWPRHTGDFSMFRVYASKDNKPSPYNKDNKPYTTQSFLSINVSGYKEGDFTMVYGFPGTTQEYISSYQLNQVYSIIDPIRIYVRTKKLGVWTQHMTDSREVFLKYTSKRAGVANGWKKWQGEVRGLKINEVVKKKGEFEKEFQSWASGQDSLPYAKDLLAKIMAQTLYADSAIKAEVYLQESIMGIELMQQTAVLEKMLQVIRAKLPEQKWKDSLQKLLTTTDGAFKNYDEPTDKDLFKVLMPEYLKSAGIYTPISYRKEFASYNKDMTLWSNDVYGMSLMANQNSIQKFVNNISLGDTMRILSDPAYRLYLAATNYKKETIQPIITQYNNSMNDLNRLYMKAQMVMKSDKMFYPDANLTLRLAYGKVEGMDPDGPANYSFQTNLDDMIAKDNPEVEEFRVPKKLKELFQKKDYGKWAVNGTVPVAFIATNHTSGGNSGSPVLNAKGQLIGTNFDRVWEGTMSDYYFDPKLCRNISLDIRYTLFIVEKFGGAGWLLKEMNLVKK